MFQLQRTELNPACALSFPGVWLQKRTGFLFLTFSTDATLLVHHLPLYLCFSVMKQTPVLFLLRGFFSSDTRILLSRKNTWCFPEQRRLFFSPCEMMPDWFGCWEKTLQMFLLCFFFIPHPSGRVVGCSERWSNHRWRGWRRGRGRGQFVFRNIARTLVKWTTVSELCGWWISFTRLPIYLPTTDYVSYLISASFLLNTAGS